MKRTNAQFAVVFVGVLLLHLAAATALMKSARMDEPSASVDPTYHSTGKNQEPTRGPAGESDRGLPPKAAEPEKSSEVKPGIRESIPDAFANTGGARASRNSLDPVPPPPIPDTVPPKPAPAKDPAPESTTRRLTVNQLLAESSADPDTMPAAEPVQDSAPPGLPEIKRLAPVDSKTGPRKIRSLSGN